MKDYQSLKAESDRIVKGQVELNKKYPERRNKSKTYVVDYQGMQAKDGVPNNFERECLSSISVSPGGETRVLLDFSLTIEKFPETDRIILAKRREGWSEQEIALFVNKARRTVIRKLNNMFRKLGKILK